MRSYRYLHLDVFTDRLFGGNQLAVVLDGRGLTAGTMQAIAKEMNFSETTFVLPAEDPGTDVRVRIFTPGEELPMAGHPTVGTAFALARVGVLAPSTPRTVFGLGVGPTDVALTWFDSALTSATMTQLPPVFGAPIEHRERFADALSLSTDEFVPSLPVQVVTCGVPYVIVPLRSRAAVDSAALDATRHARLLQALELERNVCLYLFTTEEGADGATAYSRMFGPAVGIVEDPATGSAAGPLGSYLVTHGVVTPQSGQPMRVLQGVLMGRPSEMLVTIDQGDRRVSRVRVGGTAVLAGEGTLYLP